jgi:hypothetical protein
MSSFCLPCRGRLSAASRPGFGIPARGGAKFYNSHPETVV